MAFVVNFSLNKPKKGKCKPKIFLPESSYPNELLTLGTVIPISKLPIHVYVSLQFTKRSITEYINLINHHVDQYKCLKRKNNKADLSYNYNYIVEKQQCFQFIIKTIVSLRRFVQLWLYKKYRVKQLNTEDPATLCVPTRPIHIFDTNAKGTYTFEMSTIKKQFTSDLLYSDWLFPHVHQPKNPFTNLPFTKSQIIHIIYFLKSNSMTNWYLEAYKEHKFNENKFQEELYIPLRLFALNNLIQNTSSEQFTELVFEFIEDHYNYHDCSCKSHLNILCWAVTKRPSDLYIKKWIDIFYKFMRVEILYGKNYLDEHDALAFTYYSETKKLLYDAKELDRLGFMRLQSIPKRLNQVIILSEDV